MPILVDATVLSNLAAAGRLDLLSLLRAPPYLASAAKVYALSLDTIHSARGGPVSARFTGSLVRDESVSLYRCLDVWPNFLRCVFSLKDASHHGARYQ